MPVTLREKGKDAVLDKKTVHARRHGKTREGAAGVQADGAGREDLHHRDPVQPDEADKEDNRVNGQVFVREAKLIKVLYVEGYRRYEYHFLKTLLERESDRTRATRASTSRWCC